MTNVWQIVFYVADCFQHFFARLAAGTDMFDTFEPCFSAGRLAETRLACRTNVADRNAAIAELKKSKSERLRGQRQLVQFTQHFFRKTFVNFLFLESKQKDTSFSFFRIMSENCIVKVCFPPPPPIQLAAFATTKEEREKYLRADEEEFRAKNPDSIYKRMSDEELDTMRDDMNTKMKIMRERDMAEAKEWGMTFSKPPY